MTFAEDVAKIEKQAVVDELKAESAAKREFDKTYYSALLETTKASIERSRASGELVEKAATAIGALYGTVIGVSFSVTDRPISARALLPVLFLGIAIMCSMIYLAFPTPGDPTAAVIPTTARPERMRRQVNRYIQMVQEFTSRRAYYLRASVAALGIAVVLLPAPFIDDPQTKPPAASAPAAFPNPRPVHNEAQATVEAIRYQAEIDEIVASRKPASTAQENWPAWAWSALVAGLVITFGIPKVVKKR